MDGERPPRTTERANPRSAGLDALPAREALRVFQEEDERMLAAVDGCAEELAAAVDLVAARLAAGGSLLYVGAGTSGRLGVLDAVECPPTFGTDPRLVRAALAGGPEALLSSVEGAEDSEEAGAAAVDAEGVGPRDVVLGISAGGATPFVRAALARARERGAATIVLACVPRGELSIDADLAVLPVVGPEVLAGSTRLKAGTATKIVLGRLSTLVMARLGKAHDNLMIDVDTRGNRKLEARGVALVRVLTGTDEPRARELLAAAAGRVKTAALMHAASCSRDEAERRLEAAGGVLRRALRR